jgi:hypothetical protein
MLLMIDLWMIVFEIYGKTAPGRPEYYFGGLGKNY